MTTPDITPESPEYTPTTAAIRESHAFTVQSKIAGGTFGQGLAEFDRWLAAHDVEVARKAAEIAWELGGAEHIAWVNALTDMGPDYPIPVNPYRAEQIGEK